MNDFLYFLTDHRGYCYHVDLNGEVKLSYTPISIIYTPDEWENVELKFGRHSTYFGLQRSFSVPLKFVMDAGKIVRYIAYNFGCEGVLKLIIYQLDKSFGGGLQHKLFFASELDLSKFENGETSVTSMLMEGGAEMIFKAGENTEFEIDVTNDPEALDVYMDGMEFVYKTSYLNVSEDLEVSAMGEFNKINYIKSIANLGGETSLLNLVTNDIFLSENIGYENFPTDGRWFAQSVDNITPGFRFKQDLVIEQDSKGRSGEVDYYITNQNNQRLVSFIDFSVPDGTFNRTFNIDRTFDLQLQKGDRLFLVLELGVRRQAISSGEAHLRAFISEGTLSLEYKSRFKPTIIKALPGATLFRRLMEKIFGGAIQVKSSLLDTTKNFVFTCGDALRGLGNSKIKISFATFYKHIHFRECAGFAFENNVAVLEKRSYWLDDSTPEIDLGDAKCTVKYADDLMYNTVKVGYANQTYDNVNGRDEFNVTQKYSLPIKRVIREYDITSDIRADSYGIELTRMNLDGKTTTDNKADADTFTLDIEQTLSTVYGVGLPKRAYRLFRGPYNELTGVISPNTIFNVRLSPKTRLLEHWPVLRSILSYHLQENIVFNKGDKNSALSYTYNGKTISENSNLAIASLLRTAFKPWYFEIDVNPPNLLAEYMQMNPRARVRFNYAGTTWHGYIIEAGTKPATKAEQKWKILASSNNDMTKLI